LQNRLEAQRNQAGINALRATGGRAITGLVVLGAIAGGAYLFYKMFGKKLPAHNINDADLVDAPKDAKDAAEFYESIQWGKKPDKVLELGDMSPPKWLVEIGDLRAVVYDSDKGGEGKEKYIHHFKNPKPKLATDPKGERLYVAGGGYHTNWRGIVG
jgi:hypothetical protein